MGRTATETINRYLTDMEALESHLEKALRAQVAALMVDQPDLAAHLKPIHIRSQQHLQVLQAVADAREAGAENTLADAVDRIGSAVAGLGGPTKAVARNEKLPRDLGDDYAALSLAAIGYVMMMTTARSLGEESVADMAELHLRDYAEATMTLHNIIPAVVVKSLQEQGLPARDDVLPSLGQDLEEVWRGEADSGTVPDVFGARTSR